MTQPQDQREPRDGEPGGESTPQDTEGAGPVGLQDRVRTSGTGSPATNQGDAEPMPSSPDHRDPNAPLEPPTLDEMTVGASDPQRPSLPTAAPTAARGSGREVPVDDSAGEAHRAPGLQGTTPPGEQVETDVEASAAEMVRDTGRPSGAGDVHGVPVPSETASPGTSEESGVVQGARLPGPDGSPQE